MGKVLKIIGIIILVLIILVVGAFVYISHMPSVPHNYTKEVKTGGSIEAKYLDMGEFAVKNIKSEASELTKYYYVYYPEELENSDKKYPVIVVLNGTGVLPNKYTALFNHLASWGFIVIGNDDESTGFGKSADETMDYIISANKDENNVLYQKIDLEKIGITGHSQGGAGVFTATSVMDHKDIYKTAVSLSPTNEEMALAFGWNYDLTKINIPTLMIAGASGEFETETVIPIHKMTEMYHKISGSKVMMRRTTADHGAMLYQADGYVTAWFMWQLQNDSDASKAFVGSDAEIKSNTLYQDLEINLDNQIER